MCEDEWCQLQLLEQLTEEREHQRQQCGERNRKADEKDACIACKKRAPEVVIVGIMGASKKAHSLQGMPLPEALRAIYRCSGPDTRWGSGLVFGSPKIERNVPSRVIRCENIFS